MKIAIIVAIDQEFEHLKSLLDGATEGRLYGHDIILSQCGIGKVNAAVGTTRLIASHRPDCIVSTGLAGGIDASLRVMDVVAARQTAYHDVYCGPGNEKGQVQGLPARFDADPDLLRAVLSIPQDEGGRIFEGLTCTGDQFITDRAELDVIKGNFPEALAVDMESAAIAQTCYLHRIPFLSLRVVSDTPGNTDNHQQQWDEFLASMGEHSFNIVKRFLENIR